MYTLVPPPGLGHALRSSTSWFKLEFQTHISHFSLHVSKWPNRGTPYFLVIFVKTTNTAFYSELLLRPEPPA